MPEINKKIRDLQIEITQLIGTPVRLSLFLPPVSIKGAYRIREKQVFDKGGNPIIVNFDTVLAAVAKVHGVSPADILSHNRETQNVRPRECLSYMLYVYFDIYSYQNIAFLMGNRNHSTIMHQIKGYKTNLQLDREHWMEVIDRVKKEMGL